MGREKGDGKGKGQRIVKKSKCQPSNTGDKGGLHRAVLGAGCQGGGQLGHAPTRLRAPLAQVDPLVVAGRIQEVEQGQVDGNLVGEGGNLTARQTQKLFLLRGVEGEGRVAGIRHVFPRALVTKTKVVLH